MTQIKPNIGSVVKVTTRHKSIYLWGDQEFDDATYEGIVVRSNPWDQPDSFKMQVNNPLHPNPIIALRNVHNLEFVSGEGQQVGSGVKVVKVQGSKGNVYTVMNIGGQWRCDCPGYTFRKACKHLDQARNANV